MLNLMIGLNGYTLCSGIICEELNGNDYVAVPFQDDEQNPNSVMEIGYITRKNTHAQQNGSAVCGIDLKISVDLNDIDHELRLRYENTEMPVIK